MIESNDYLDKLRLFHFTTLVPVCLFNHTKIVCSLPEQINYLNALIPEIYSIESILTVPNSNANVVKAFYYKNEYEECFILVELDQDLKLLAGPMLNERMLEGDISNMIRQRKFPIKLKGKLCAYYDSLMIMDSNRLYYLGRYIEWLLPSAQSSKTNDGMPLEANFLPDEYFVSIVNNRESQFHHPPYFLEQELLSKIKVGNLTDSLTILKEINSLKRSKLAGDTYRSIKNSLICSITLFTRAAIEGGVQPETAFTLSDSLILDIEGIANLSWLIDLEYKAVEQFIRLVQTLSIHNYSNTIKQALSFINKNLTNRLTLSEIATAIYVHPNYLSSLFKKEVGMTLSDYISKARVEEAKYYIKYTNTKISDIASFYQFCNQSYFISTFRKFTGLTPNEFRNLQTLKL